MSEHLPSELLELVNRIADCFRPFGVVQAVAWSDPGMDSGIDLYVFTTEPISIYDRDRIADRNGAARRNDDRAVQQPCDEWLDPKTGIAVDLTYWDPAWIEEQIARVLEHHEPALGYTTAFWGTILRAQILYDKNGWLTALKTRLERPFPEELRRQIIIRNYAMLRGSLSSYLHQIEIAVQRDDPVGLQHRITALLSSYFDVLFALNRRPHPGEKQLLANALRLEKQPAEMESDVRALLAYSPPTQDLPVILERLLDRLDALLVGEGFDLAAG